MAAHAHKPDERLSSPPPPDIFARRLKDDPALIESRCVLCGALIVGSVLDGLPEQEHYHQKHCHPAKKSPKHA